jgi:hypothetical protein
MIVPLARESVKFYFKYPHGFPKIGVWWFGRRLRRLPNHQESILLSILRKPCLRTAHRLRLESGDYNISDKHLAGAIAELIGRGVLVS